MARQMFFRAAENYSDARESTGVLLNRMAPEIVQAAKQRLEGAIKTLQESWQERLLAQGEQVRAYLASRMQNAKPEASHAVGMQVAFWYLKVPDYLRNAKDKACTIAVAGNQSPLATTFKHLRPFRTQGVGKSSFLRAFLGYEQVTAPTTTTEPVPYLYPLEQLVCTKSPLMTI